MALTVRLLPEVKVFPERLRVPAISFEVPSISKFPAPKIPPELSTVNLAVPETLAEIKGPVDCCSIVTADWADDVAKTANRSSTSTAP